MWTGAGPQLGGEPNSPAPPLGPKGGSRLPPGGGGGGAEFIFIFIPEFDHDLDLDLDLKRNKALQKSMRKMLFMFMQKRKFQNIVFFIDV